MNKTQTNWDRMYLNTQETLDANTTLWNTIPIVVTTKNQFDELIQRIADVNEKTNPNSKAVTASKEKTKTALANKIVVISGIMQAFAAFNDNTVLLGKVKITQSDIYNARETDVEKLVSPVIDEARKYLTDLADFGLTEAMITEAETTLDDFKAQIGQPRTIRNQAYAAMTLMDELFDESNALLKNKMDKLMIRFKFTDTQFYSEYERARTIVD